MFSLEKWQTRKKTGKALHVSFLPPFSTCQPFSSTCFQNKLPFTIPSSWHGDFIPQFNQSGTLEKFPLRFDKNVWWGLQPPSIIWPQYLPTCVICEQFFFSQQQTCTLTLLLFLFSYSIFYANAVARGFSKNIVEFIRHAIVYSIFCRIMKIQQYFPCFFGVLKTIDPITP